MTFSLPALSAWRSIAAQRDDGDDDDGDDNENDDDDDDDDDDEGGGRPGKRSLIKSKPRIQTRILG